MPTYVNEHGEFVDSFEPRPRLTLRHEEVEDWNAPLSEDDDSATKKYMRVCDVCGEPFHTNSPQQKRCSADCRREHDRKRRARKAAGR